MNHEKKTLEQYLEELNANYPHMYVEAVKCCAGMATTTAIATTLLTKEEEEDVHQIKLADTLKRICVDSIHFIIVMTVGNDVEKRLRMSAQAKELADLMNGD